MTKESRQAERAARFWNEYYKPEVVLPCEESAVLNYTSSSHDTCHEWICSPEDIIPLLPPRLLQEGVYRVLEIGCGDSTLAETIYNESPELTYYLGLDISQQVIDNMNHKHNLKNHTQNCCNNDHDMFSHGLHYEVANILDISPILCPTNSFHLIIDKGTSDTMQYRAPKDDCKLLLHRLFAAIYNLLVPGGTYVIISPKYSIKGLRTTVPWEVTRTPLQLQHSEIHLDNPSNKGTVYAHICTKGVNSCNGGSGDVSSQEWLYCPHCKKSRDEMQIRGEKWRIHRKYCKDTCTPHNDS